MKFIKCGDTVVNMDQVCSVAKAGLNSKFHFVCGKEEELPADFNKIVEVFAPYKENVFTAAEEKKKHRVDPTYEPAETVADLEAALAEGGEVSVELTSDMDLGTKIMTIPAGSVVNMKLDSVVTCNKAAFSVEDGARLNLTGEGTIVVTDKSTSSSAINVSGPNAFLSFDGPTLDCVSTKGKNGNYSYGIYLKKDACMEFKSGVIRCAYGSCISTNNTTGGATTINISGGELYSDGSYAIYLPSQATVNITGGIVQGINARMGIFNIKGDAKIIGTTITDADYDDIGLNIGTSGCIWFGDTIALISGTYTDEDGLQTAVNISGDATVDSAYRAAIGVYEVDTAAQQRVRIKVQDISKVKTTAEGFKDIEVYDHDYIAAAAEAKGKTFEPQYQTEMKIVV